MGASPLKPGTSLPSRRPVDRALAHVPRRAELSDGSRIDGARVRVTPDHRADPTGRTDATKLQLHKTRDADLEVREVTIYEQGHRTPVLYSNQFEQEKRANSVEVTLPALEKGKNYVAVARVQGASGETTDVRTNFEWPARVGWYDWAPHPKDLPLPPVARTFRFQPTDMPKEVAASGLTPEQMDSLRAHSRGVTDVFSWLDHEHDLRLGRFGGGGYVLGASNLNAAIHERLAQVTFSQSWESGYRRFFGTELATEPGRPGAPPLPVAHTAEFLTRLAQTGERVTFLVPPDALTATHHGRSTVTADELRYLLDHPALMKNVQFVFGAYSVEQPRSVVGSPAMGTLLWHHRDLMGE